MIVWREYMIKKLARSLREYKKDSILTPVLITIEVLIEVMIPFLMAYLIDYGIDGGDMSAVMKLGLLLLVAAATSLTVGALAGKTAAKASAGFAKNLREDMFHNIQNFSFSNIDKFSTSSIITRLTTDVTHVQNAYQMIIRIAVRSPIMLIFALIAAFSIDAQLSLIFVAIAPFLLLGLYLIIKNAHPIFVRIFKTYDVLNRIVQENLHGMRVVKSFNREAYEEKKFTDVSKNIYEDFSFVEKLLAFNMPLIQLCAYASMLLLSWFGAKAIVLSGNNPNIGLTTGQFMSLIAYTMQILMSLMMFSMVLVMIVISKASAQRITELIEEESDLQNGTNPITTVTNGEIVFENVDFGYSEGEDKRCLKNVDLHIKSGQTIGIIGGTGSSKTSLVQLIPRLYDVTGGRVLVGGVDVREYHLDTLREAVGMVLQKNILFAGTIKENLRWGNETASDEELIRVCQIANADEFIQNFPEKYDTLIEQGGANVSGGQRQRLCIARALLKKPKILILDDSTSAVDTKTDLQIRTALKEELADTTTLIIAQRVSSVQDADQILVMEDGEICGIGTHLELLTSNTIYREVYDSQTKEATVHE
jgi:ATP-binding cassette subfamily B protein